MNDIAVLAAGAVVLLITGVLIWYCLPRDGKTYRFADTEWEPYIGVAFCSGIALGITMILSSVINIYGQGPRFFDKRFHNLWDHVPILDAGVRYRFYSMGALSVYEERMIHEFHRRSYFGCGWSRHDLFRKSERGRAVAYLPRLDRWQTLSNDSDDTGGLWRCGNYRKLALGDARLNQNRDVI